MKKVTETHMRIVSADISSESLTGMVIFRPHYVSRANPHAPGPTKSGLWYALPPSEVRSLARALLDAADAMEQKAKALQALKPATG
jgi:hypothetical protein